ncbi:hypothetical protein NECAME_17327 [Necator americanus]|uniref:C2H2-type domain-containing protein n=1 Tax=Necator americanus TaxID=51031 RepID=W2TS61_NECAM|nr:hypothetical protein NECAME_17327 [Necator americanus]ETN83837.1 hypothetical protein NECAME_17327 [Necator americanus]
MLFLTFSNQIIRYTNGRSVSLACATAVANVVYQLSEGENTPGATDVAAISKIFQSESSFSPSSSVKTIRKSPVNKELKGVRPIFAKHNDAKFYPNIMCVICKEWVCSRSRRIHISAHFGYRKYTCSTCDFSHTKEIFVETHIRKCHNRVGSVLQKDDPAVESRIEDACNDSIAMTRDVLRGQYDDEIYASYANMSTMIMTDLALRARSVIIICITFNTVYGNGRAIDIYVNRGYNYALAAINVHPPSN